MVNRVNQQNQQTPEESEKKMKNNNNHPVGILLKSCEFRHRNIFLIKNGIVIESDLVS